MYGKVTSNCFKNINAKQVDNNCIINKPDKLLVGNRIDTLNNKYIQSILSKKNIGLEYSRPDNFRHQKQVIKADLIAEQGQKSINKSIENNINILRQIDYLIPYLPDKNNLESRRVVFDLYVHNKIRRSEEFQEESVKKARLNPEMVKVRILLTLG
jgi:hypothetical protein